MKIALLQPKYPHGNKSQTYLPGGLMNLGSRLLEAGVEVEFCDLNHMKWSEEREMLDGCDLIGLTILGAPYIPVVIALIKEMRAAGVTQPILVGGEGVARLESGHFNVWFAGLDAWQAKSDLAIASACGIKHHMLRSAYETSMVPMLKQLSKDQLREYLTAEFSLFTSQGCAFNCDFCAADKARKEQYRTIESLADELRFICQFLQGVGHSELRVYVTNLDAFQTPEKLEEVLHSICSIASEYGITPHVRCLATSKCTHHACRSDPGLAKRLHDYGLKIVAFGADGADEETWEEQNKRHNDLKELRFACSEMENADIEVELLMVIGFPRKPNRTFRQYFKSLWKGFLFSLAEAMRGRIIRPYLAKQHTPSGPWPADNPLVRAFLEDSNLLMRLDYAMIGSKETHPDRAERFVVNAVYLAIIALLTPVGKCPTSPLVPVPRGFGRSLASAVNRLMPFDR